MSLKSSDDEDGFPGELDVNITYGLTTDNKLSITYAAQTKHKPTPINLSSRLFFNLAGEVCKHFLPISPLGWAGCYTCPALRPYQFGPVRILRKIK